MTLRSPKTRQRAQQKRAEETRQRLLAAAIEMFATVGFEGVTVAALEEEAGVQRGLLRYHFDSKDALFLALVADMSENVKSSARAALSEDMSALEIEAAALAAFLDFASEHKEIYRIIDEAEFVDPASYRTHYETIAERIAGRLKGGAERGEFRDDLGEVEAWAIMGMNVFVGLRYAVWGDGQRSSQDIAAAVNRLLAQGVQRT